MNGRPVILLLHGYCGGPGEIQALKHAFDAAGYTTSAPQLAGHTGRREDINHSSYRQWLQSAEKAYKALHEKYEQIIVVGFSMGALLALYLSVKYPVTAVVTINCPVYFLNVPSNFHRFFQDVAIRDLTETFTTFESMKKTTFRSNMEFLKIHRLIYPMLKQVSAPVYCNQSADDRTVFGMPSIRWLLTRLPSKKVSYTIYKKGGHQILLSDNRQRLIDNILTYCERY